MQHIYRLEHPAEQYCQLPFSGHDSLVIFRFVLATCVGTYIDHLGSLGTQKAWFHNEVEAAARINDDSNQNNVVVKMAPDIICIAAMLILARCCRAEEI